MWVYNDKLTELIPALPSLWFGVTLLSSSLQSIFSETSSVFAKGSSSCLTSDKSEQITFKVLLLMLLIDGNVLLTTCYVLVGIWSCHVFEYFSPSLRINHVVVMQKTGKNINKVLLKILRKTMLLICSNMVQTKMVLILKKSWLKLFDIKNGWSPAAFHNSKKEQPILELPSGFNGRLMLKVVFLTGSHLSLVGSG